MEAESKSCNDSNIENLLDDHAGLQSISELSALPPSLVSFLHESSAIINNE